MMEIRFNEIQKFNQWWLWLLLIALGILPFYASYKKWFVAEVATNESISNFELILLTSILVGIILLFLIMRLETEINQNEIKFRFIPFIKKRVKWTEIKRAEVINYGFVGGSGIRIWTKYGTVYNTKGNIGLSIELKSGKKFLIGTQKKEELNKVLSKIIALN